MAWPPTRGDTCATADGEGLGRLTAHGARRIGWLTGGGVEAPAAADSLEGVFLTATVAEVAPLVDLDLLAGADTSCMVLVTSSVRRKVSSRGPEAKNC